MHKRDYLEMKISRHHTSNHGSVSSLLHRVQVLDSNEYAIDNALLSKRPAIEEAVEISSKKICQDMRGVCGFSLLPPMSSLPNNKFLYSVLSSSLYHEIRHGFVEGMKKTIFILEHIYENKMKGFLSDSEREGSGVLLHEGMNLEIAHSLAVKAWRISDANLKNKSRTKLVKPRAGSMAVLHEPYQYIRVLLHAMKVWVNVKTFLHTISNKGDIMAWQCDKVEGSLRQLKESIDKVRATNVIFNAKGIYNKRSAEVLELLSTDKDISPLQVEDRLFSSKKDLKEFCKSCIERQKEIIVENDKIDSSGIPIVYYLRDAPEKNPIFVNIDYCYEALESASNESDITRVDTVESLQSQGNAKPISQSKSHDEEGMLSVSNPKNTSEGEFSFNHADIGTSVQSSNGIDKGSFPMMTPQQPFMVSQAGNDVSAATSRTENMSNGDVRPSLPLPAKPWLFLSSCGNIMWPPVSMNVPEEHNMRMQLQVNKELFMDAFRNSGPCFLYTSHNSQDHLSNLVLRRDYSFLHIASTGLLGKCNNNHFHAPINIAPSMQAREEMVHNNFPEDSDKIKICVEDVCNETSGYVLMPQLSCFFQSDARTL